MTSRTFCENEKCKKEFEHKAREKRKYCSKSCAAQVNNAKSPKRKYSGRCSKCLNSCSESSQICQECLHILKNKVEKVVSLICLYCKESFASNLRHKKYCSKTCSNEYSKVHSGKDYEKSNKCSCGGEKTLYANNCVDCHHRKQYEKKIQKWLSGEWDGSKTDKYTLSKTIRRYLLEKANYACEKCGFDTPHPIDQSSILEIDHIDGDGSNNSPENLRVLCPNCHALTPTYRARNTGRGRKKYYLRVDKTMIDDVL